ncbi:MAG: hypothetical protein L0Z54_04455, partial [Thermoplasmata archaeon]|nr:hypothetical protein [Thermoplasmata archaeon]
MRRRGSFYAEIYGCSMDRGEAELFLRSLEGAGLSPTGDPSEADMSFLFTCAVIASPERRMLSAIRA